MFFIIYRKEKNIKEKDEKKEKKTKEEIYFSFYWNAHTDTYYGFWIDVQGLPAARCERFPKNRTSTLQYNKCQCAHSNKN